MPPHILESFLTLRSARAATAPHRRIRVRSAGGIELLVGVFESDPASTQDVLIIFHGAGAHMAAGYLDLAADVYRHSGCGVLVPDLRGHGRSGGVRGAVDEAATVWRDIDAVAKCALTRYPAARLHVGGHSLGAGLALNWATYSPDAQRFIEQGRMRSLFLLAPYTGLEDVYRSDAATFINAGPGDDGVRFDYSTEIAEAAGLQRHIDTAFFKALSPADFPSQVRRLLDETALRIIMLPALDDELFDARAMLRAAQTLAEGTRDRLFIECLPATHLGCLFAAGGPIASALLSGETCS